MLLQNLSNALAAKVAAAAAEAEAIEQQRVNIMLTRRASLELIAVIAKELNALGWNVDTSPGEVWVGMNFLCLKVTEDGLIKVSGRNVPSREVASCYLVEVVEEIMLCDI